MKHLSIALFTTLISLISYCQKQPQKNIHVDTAAQVNIYGNGHVYIGTVIINQTIKTKIYLLGVDQQKDSTGIYTTIFSFGNKETLPLFGVNITIEFSDPIIIADIGGSAMTSVAYGYNENKTAFQFTAGQINRNSLGGNEIFTILAKSKTRLHFAIHGIDGAMK